MSNDCPNMGTGGMHSSAFLEEPGGICCWCGAVSPEKADVQEVQETFVQGLQQLAAREAVNHVQDTDTGGVENDLVPLGGPVGEDRTRGVVRG